MAKFKCVHSGTILEFTIPADIEGLRKHPEYVEVKEEEVKEEAVDSPPKQKTLSLPKNK